MSDKFWENKELHKNIHNIIFSKSVFIPDGNNKLAREDLLKGNIYYNFFNGKYTTIKPLEERIKKMCILIVNGNNFAVGLQYNKDCTAPILILKTYEIKRITEICTRNKITIIYNKNLAEHIFHNDKEYSVVHSGIWEDIARVFAILTIIDKAFAEKIDYKS